MIRLASFSLLCALTLVPVPAHAAGECDPGKTSGCIEKSCDQLGKTVIDFDKQNLLTCLCQSAASPCVQVWRPMTSDVLAFGTFVCPVNQFLTGIVNDKPQCTGFGSATITCPAGIRAFSNGIPICGTPQYAQ
ncbi:MAG: hypothetical protein WC464_01635 [Bdellovibrionales bacterium]